MLGFFHRMSPYAAKSALFLGAMIVVTANWFPLFRKLDATGISDWVYFQHMWEAARVALIRYGEPLLWNPFQCGGVTMWGNPQNQTYAPWFLISLLVGTTLGLKLFVWSHALVGLVGMYVLGRREYGLTAAPAGLAAVAWSCSGAVAWDGRDGHATFFSFLLTPWILLAWRRAAGDPRWCAAVALLVLALLLDGGTYSVAYLPLLLAFDAAWRLTGQKTRRGIVPAGLLCALLAGAVSLFRVLPAIETTLDHPRRRWWSSDSLELSEFLDILTARWQPLVNPLHDHTWGWNEYGGFVGWTVVVLGAAGVLALLGQRKHGHLIAGAALFAALMMGDRGPWWPWPLLQHIPPYDGLRVPTRFLIYFIFYLALLSGVGLQVVVSWLGRDRAQTAIARLLPIAPWLVMVGAGVDIVAANHPTVRAGWLGPSLELKPPGRFQLRWTHPRSQQYASFPQRNFGTLRCFEAFDWRVPTSLWAGDHPQARILHARGEVSGWGRTANTVWASVRLEDPGRVLFNQTFAEDWVPSVGVSVNRLGQLAVDVPVGEHEINVRYRPRELPWVLLLLVMGLLGCGVTARWASAPRLEFLDPWRLSAGRRS